MVKICKKCLKELPLTSFHKKKSGKFGVKANCKVCDAKWQKDHYQKPEIKQKRISRQSKTEYQLYIRSFRLKRNYGITLADYEAMLMLQNNCCAICFDIKPGGSKNTYFHVDHDHKTGKVRQLLCSRCNTVLGQVADNPTILSAMIKYLEKH